MNEVRKVIVRLKSVVDGNEEIREYSGEYALKDDIHNIVYTDYTGNAVTKVGIQAGAESMLLHRTGHFEVDMYFDPASDTVMKYRADLVRAGFLLHTYEYAVEELEDGLRLQVRYGLNDGSEAEEIAGRQEITVIWEETL